MGKSIRRGFVCLKVLLVNTLNYPYYPCLGLGYIGTYLQVHGHKVIIFDVGKGFKKYEETLLSFKPDFVGFNSFTAGMTTLKNLIQLTRSHSDTQIVIGGHHANAEPLETFKTLKPDFVVLGEGEHKMLQLVEQTVAPSKMDGLLTEVNGQLYESYKVDFIKNLDDLPFPDRKLMNAEECEGDWMVKRTPYTSAITGRGCPYSCSFCANNVMWKRRFRKRSIHNVLDEVEELLSEGWKEIYFADDTFTVVKDYVLRFCKEIHDRGLDFTWKVFARVDTVDSEMLKSMKKAGCHLLCFGVESGNQKTLDLFNKGTDLDTIKSAFQLCHKIRINTNACLIFNVLGETKQDFLNTLDLVKEIRPNWLALCPLTPFPGTELRSKMLSLGLGVSEDFEDYRTDQFKVFQSYMLDMSPREIEKKAHEFVYDYLSQWSFCPKILSYGFSGFKQWLWTVQFNGEKAGRRFSYFYKLFYRYLHYMEGMLKND